MLSTYPIGRFVDQLTLQMSKKIRKQKNRKNENEKQNGNEMKIKNGTKSKPRTYLLLRLSEFFRNTGLESGREKKESRGGERKISSPILLLFPPLPSLTWTVTWHRMTSFAVHVNVYALLAVDLDISKGGSGFGRFSKAHDVW